MSTQESEAMETKRENPSLVRIESDYHDRVTAAIPAICRTTGMHRINATAAVHHLLDLALKQYERPQ
jgi:hypothetical protein